MSRVVTNPQPKMRFQESGSNISQHRELLQNVAFDRAIDWAFLQYQYQLCTEQGSLNDAAGKHLRLTGAHEFVNTLKYLAESRVLETASHIQNLDHKV